MPDGLNAICMMLICDFCRNVIFDLSMNISTCLYLSTYLPVIFPLGCQTGISNLTCLKQLHFLPKVCLPFSGLSQQIASLSTHLEKPKPRRHSCILFPSFSTFSARIIPIDSVYSSNEFSFLPPHYYLALPSSYLPRPDDRPTRLL